MPDCSPGAFARATRLRKPEQFAAAAGERATWRATRPLVAASARVQPAVGAEPGPDALGSRDSVDGSASIAHAKDGTNSVVDHIANGGMDCVRFGFTVARRQARRAVQRALVKRVLREAARNAAAGLRSLAVDRSVDVVLRLRSPLPDRCHMTRAQVKRVLRAEADSLIAQLARHLRSRAP